MHCFSAKRGHHTQHTACWHIDMKHTGHRHNSDCLALMKVKTAELHNAVAEQPKEVLITKTGVN